MVTFITIIFAVISLITIVGYALILLGILPMQLSIIYSVLSLYFYYLKCQSNIDAKKIRLYNIRNFFMVIFLNVLLLPYIDNFKIRILVLSVSFIIGLILTLVIMKIDNKLVKKLRELRIYASYTFFIGVLFESGRISSPYIYENIYKKYPFISDILLIASLIIGIISVRKEKRKRNKIYK